MDLPRLPDRQRHAKENARNGKKKIAGFKMEMKFNLKDILLYVVVGLLVVLAVSSFMGPSGGVEKKPISQVLADAKDGKIKEIIVSEDNLTVKYKDGKTVESQKDPNQDLNRTLFSKDELGLDPKSLTLVNRDDVSKNFFVNMLLQFGPIVLFFGLLVWLYRRQGGNSIFSFGQSPAKLYSKDMPKITFKDVAGVDEAKKELEEVVDFLKNPKKYAAVGARTPKGVLLVGPSGTGKTLLAKAIAGEAGVPFFSMAGSEFMEMLVGVGASVTGDTPILIKRGDNYELQPIGEFVDKYYESGNEGGIKMVAGVEALGFEKKQTKFWGTKGKSEKFVFGKSAFKGVSGVFRHKVNEIYEIEYLDGTIRATGDHSVFIRTHGWIKSIPVSELREGDLLVNLPMNVRHWDGQQTIHETKAHEFSSLKNEMYLDFWNEDEELKRRYQFVMDYQGVMTQAAIGAKIGVSQATVGNWQNQTYTPQLLSRKLVKLELPDEVEVTAGLMKLLGFYTAEGRGHGRLEFVFASDEKELHEEVIVSMRDCFGVKVSKVEHTNDNSTRLIYYSHHLGRFFERQCGSGAHKKHVPNFLWGLPKEYFLQYLEGLYLGDGYITRSNKLSITSVSKQLITELAWLCAMHGIKAGVKHGILQEGRIIKNKSLPAGDYWNLIIGKTSNPFVEPSEHPNQIKRAIVRRVTKKPFDGFVYDLVGVENEAFFGGEKPVLLHNSRARDLFATAKKNKPAIIFIDEIDAVGRTRSVGIVGGHDEREQTLNQILIEMDGFEPNEQVVVIGASVTGDTLILTKDNGQIRIVPIGELIDSFYEGQEEGEIGVEGLETLGFERKVSERSSFESQLYFQHSAFKKVRSIFRHRVREIYRIKYLGGEIRATGNHSVFVRTHQGLKTKAVSELKAGDVLVDLPLKVRLRGEKVEYRSHLFEEGWKLELPVFDPTTEDVWQRKYLTATQNPQRWSQSHLASEIGVAQTTVSLWQRGIGFPRSISRNYFKHQLPERVEVTAELMRLFGYFVAEGYARDEVDFCFAREELELVADLQLLIKKVFGLEPDRVRYSTPGAVNIIYSSSPLADFLVRYCGKGAHGKHVPEFLFTAPKELFLEFLKGLFLGDGSSDRLGRGEITSVSYQLILELNWLCRMHGIKSFVGGFVTKAGRVIKGGKPLPASRAYRLGFGKTHNPFSTVQSVKKSPTKRAVVKSVVKEPFDGFVYDLCGVDNEAFFGGESPILLHNSNRGDLLDPALLRPGRFDRRIVLDLPDKEGRLAILEVHKKNKPFDSDVDWEKVAKRTVGFSGADIENMLNEAAILAARNNRDKISMADLEEAATKVKLGPQKKRLQSDLDKKMTAYHEAGHAIVTHELPYMDPVHRISIVSRGMSLGHTLIPPAADRLHETRSHLVAQIASMLGGRAAEQLIFSEMTTGASSDIQAATGIAREMVMEFGMSTLGPINLGAEPQSYGGRVLMEPQKLSEEMMKKVDEEVGKLIDEGYKLAASILKKHIKALHAVAAELVKKETIDGDEFERIVGHAKATVNNGNGLLGGNSGVSSATVSGLKGRLRRG